MLSDRRAGNREGIVTERAIELMASPGGIDFK